MTRIPVINTERLVLRGPVLHDQKGFVAFLASDRAKYAGGTKDQSKAKAEFQEMIDFWTDNELGTFTITRRSDGKAIGHVGGLRPEGWPELELGWSIWCDEDEGKGFASEAALAVLAYAFNTLDWNTAVSYVAPDNKRSIVMIERLGAVLDSAATKPEGLTCLAYRHQSPKAMQ